MKPSFSLHSSALSAPTARTARTTFSVLLLLGLWCAEIAAAHAWTLTLSAASRRVFLHVGNGTAEGSNSTVNELSATLTSAQVLTSTPLDMTSDSTQSRSLYGDGYTTCPTPASQVMVGASYRRSNGGDGPASATLRVTSPTSLTNAAGDTIPFTEISWTVAATGSSEPNVIPAGTFNGSVQTLATIAANRYIENCHSFVFANSTMRAAGTYSGQVTYTVSSP